MTGPLAKADAPLAARLAPWLELSARKAPAGGDEAQPVLRAPRVDNEVLLPQRAGLQAQAGMPPRPGLPGGAAQQHQQPQQHAGATALSGAARAILALADPHAGQAGPVRGSAALWPTATRAPASAALASALSQQLSESGLFYESHLADFAAGTRSLAQVQREPQAGLARTAADASGRAAQGDGAPQSSPRQPAGGLPVASAPAPAAALPAATASAVAALTPAMPSPLQAPPASDAPAPAVERAGQAGAAAPGREQAAQNVLQEYALPRTGQPAAGAQAMPGAASAHDATGAAQAAQAAAADMPAPAALIHPQAAALVHQQLDLLAGAMFRWSGEAWPGVPMEWSVQEEGERAPADEPADAKACWSTALSIELPRLGPVKVALRLSGEDVHAQMDAAQLPTLDRLRLRGEALTQRLSGAGLRLGSLQLGRQPEQETGA